MSQMAAAGAALSSEDWAGVGAVAESGPTGAEQPGPGQGSGSPSAGSCGKQEHGARGLTGGASGSVWGGRCCWGKVGCGVAEGEDVCCGCMVT
jgi:hypothetical protein